VFDCGVQDTLLFHISLISAKHDLRSF